MRAKYKQWDRVSVGGQSGTVVTVEERRAGFADYFVEFDDSAMWIQENEIDDEQSRANQEEDCHQTPAYP